MRFKKSEHPGRSVRLAYCLNLHPAPTQAGLLEGLRAITLPLRERLAPGREFGVGMYLPAQLASRLGAREGAGELAELASFLDHHGLDPFTWNAFPAGGFGAAGLKERVFEPTWAQSERAVFTRNVARIALVLAGRAGAGGHVSISSHTGWHSVRAPRDERPAIEQLRHWGDGLRSPSAGEPPAARLILGLEAEPRANCNDSSELASWLGRLRTAARGDGPELGACLDTCHSAVEFERPEDALESATRGGAPLAKLQFTSALALRASRRRDLDALLALDEPRYLHQVTARTKDGLQRAGDLSELDRALDQPGGEAWWAESELRCHFHVPVDLAGVGDSALETTREHADALLAAALARPERWGSDELHVEIETYTWDVLPREARGSGGLVDGLEREYLHVIDRLGAGGWAPA